MAQRAQAVRVREAIKARGLLLHDAFLKFDYDRNGLLSLAEVYGALEWLGIPSLTPDDVLFFVSSISSDPHVSANRIITVHGCGGKIPNGGTAAAPLELFVANAGTAARFLTAMVCLGSGVYRLSGVERMHERPQKELIRALRALGYRIETPNDMLPAVVHGGGPRPGRKRGLDHLLPDDRRRKR